MLHGRAEIRNLSASVEKYFSTLEDKFLIVKRLCNFILVAQKPNIGLPSYFVSKLGDVQ